MKVNKNEVICKYNVTALENYSLLSLIHWCHFTARKVVLKFNNLPVTVFMKSLYLMLMLTERSFWGACCSLFSLALLSKPMEADQEI